MGNIDQISARLIDVLLIISFFTALVLLVLTGHHRHITIGEVSDDTGWDQLRVPMLGASAEFRFSVSAQMETVRKMATDYQKVVQHAADRCYAATVPALKAALIAYQDTTLASLLTSLERGPSQGFAAQFQALGQLLARSHGATVTATIHLINRKEGRLGIAVEVVSSGTNFGRNRLLMEPEEPDQSMMLAERLDILIQAGARCAAIDLSAWALERPNRIPFPGARQRREGLAHNMAGLLMKASASEFDLFAKDFLQFALDEFGVAKDRLPRHYQPYFNLAGVREARAGTVSEDPASDFIAAVKQYKKAEDAAGRLPEPARTGVRRMIMIRRVRAELISDVPRLRQDAVEWLRDKQLEVRLDCRYKLPRRPLGLVGLGKGEMVLDSLTADCLYNSACLYAKAADMTGRGDLDKHARRLLGAALVIDAGEGDLADQAKDDPDLDRLSWHFPQFIKVLREAPLPDGEIKKEWLSEIVTIVDDACAAADWRANGHAALSGSRSSRYSLTRFLHGISHPRRA